MDNLRNLLEISDAMDLLFPMIFECIQNKEVDEFHALSQVFHALGRMIP